MSRSRARFALFVGLALVGWIVWHLAGDERSRAERAPRAAADALEPAAPPVELRPASGSVAREESDETSRRVDPRATALLSAASDETATLIVQVVAKEDGTPLVGLDLWMSEGWSASFTTPRGVMQQEFADEWGRFTLEVPAGEALAYDVHVNEPGHAESAHLEVSALAPGEEREVVVELTTALEFDWFGQILDGTSQAPLAGARAERVHNTPFGEPSGDTSAPSASNGVVALPRDWWQPSYVRVECDGYATGFVKLERGHEQADTACVVPLGRAAALDVFLTDPRGAPRANLNVRLVPEPVGRVQGDLGAAWNQPEPPFEALSDAQGRCTLEGLPPATALSIDVLEGNVLLRREVRGLRLEPGERRELRWTVGGRCTLLGRTVEADGRPAAGVGVWLVPDNGQRLFPSSSYEEAVGHARSDTEGRFTLDVAAGAWALFPAALARESWGTQRSSTAIAPAAERVTIEAGQTSAEVTLTCWRGLYLSGGVDATGVPASEDWVMVTVQGEGVYHATSPRGSFFVLGPLPPGSYSLSASRTGRDGSFHSEPLTVEAGTADLELVLRPSSGLTVRVLDSRGRPVEDARVWLLSGEQYGNRVRTDEKGLAPFDNLPRLAFTLSASSDAGEFALERGVTLAAGTGQRELELRLAPAPHLRVEVLNAPEEDMQPLILLDGEPLALMFLDEGPELPLAPGEYEVALWGSAGEAQRKRVRVASEGVTRIEFDLAESR